MATTLVDDLDLGGRLTLDDQMSAALDKIGGRWVDAVEATMRGAASVRSAADRLSVDLSRAGRSITGWLRRAVSDDSGKMRDTGGRFTTSFYEGALGAAQAGSRRLLAAIGGARSPLSLQGIFSSAARGVGMLGRTIASFAGASGVLGAVLGGPVGIAGALHNLVRGAMEAGGEIEQLQLAFATLMHSSDAARVHLAELQQFAVGKPFEFAFLATQSRQLQTFGYTAREVMGMLQDFGDASSGAGTGTQGFETFTRIAGQIRTMGRMTRGQVSQLGRAGLDVDRLRQNLGLSQADFANVARAGIPAERLIAALRQSMQQQWGGGMARASATLAAKLSDLQDVIGNMRRQLYEALGPVLVPVIDRFSSFLTTNAKRIASAVALVVNTSVHLVEALVGPVYGALSDMMGRAQRDVHNSTGGMIRMMQRAALIIEGVSALIIGDNGRGVTGISAALRDRLVAAGLWPATLAIARFANRARAFLVGFTEAFIARFTRAAHTVQWFTDRLGITHGVIGTSTARARVLGAQVAALIGYFLTFRTALRFIGPLVTGIGYLTTGVQYAVRAFQALRAVMWVFGLSGGPVALVIGAVVALGALIYYLSRSGRAVAFFRRAWEGIKEVFAPVGALLERAWEGAKQLGSELATGVGAALRQLGDALRPLLGPLRLIGSFLAVTIYLALVAVGYLLTYIARGWAAFARSAIQPVVLVARAVAWLVTMIVTGWAWIGRTVIGYVAALMPHGGAFMRVLRAIGTVAMWLGRVAFGALYSFASRNLMRLWNAVSPIIAMVRNAIASAFDFILPYVGPILTGLRELASSAFSALVEIILSPFRLIAQGLVTIFRALPARLQPAELRGAVETLDSFARGNPATGTSDVMRLDINASKAAPARAANAAAAAATVTAAAVASQPAPTVVVQPAPTIVQVDGRELVRTVDRVRDDDRMRRGGTVSTTSR